MDKRTLFIRIASVVMAGSFIGIGATFVIDFFAADPSVMQEKAVTQNKVEEMARQQFQKNKELNREVEMLRERNLESMEKMASKDQEVERLVQKLASNVQLIQKLTKDRRETEASVSELENKIETTTGISAEVEAERRQREAEMDQLKARVLELQMQLKAQEQQKEALAEELDRARAGAASQADDQVSRQPVDQAPRHPEGRSPEGSQATQADSIRRSTSLLDLRGELESFSEPVRTKRKAESPKAAPIRDSMKLFKELKAENEKWRRREDAYQEKIEDFEKEVQKMEKEQERSKERWKRDSERQKRDFEKEVQRRVKHLESKLEDNERMLSRAREELQDKTEELGKLEEESRSKSKKVKIMEHEHSVALAEQEELSEKVDQIEQVHENDKVAYFYNLALAFTHAGLFTDAEKMYLRVLELNPNDAETHYNLGILYEEHLQKFESGIRHYQRFMDLTTDVERQSKVKTWVDVAKRRYGLGRQTNMESAETAFDKLFMTTPS